MTTTRKPDASNANNNAQYPDITPEFRAQINTIFDEWQENNRSFESAKEAFAELMDVAVAGDNILHQAGVHNILGVINGYRGNYDQSIQYFEKARDLYEKGNAITRLVTCDLNLGETYRLRGNFTRARAYFHTAYQAAKKLNRFDSQIIALTNEGQMWLSLRNIEKANSTLKEALELGDTPWGNPETDSDRLSRYGNICEIHHALVDIRLLEGNPYGAWQHAMQALEYAEKTGQVHRLGYARRALGNVLTELDEPLDDKYKQDPDYYFNQAVENFKQLDAEAEVGKTLFAKAKSLAKRRRRNSAGRLFQQAMVIFTRLGMTDDAAKAAEEQLRVI